MRIGILGDIHANLEALNEVLQQARRHGVTEWIQLGDVVGYGPDPRACLDLIRELDPVIVAGNHDWAVTERIPTGQFNPIARSAVEWTRDQLTPEDLDFLDSLPLITSTEFGLTCFHGSLVEPAEFHYIYDIEDALANFEALPTRVGLCGHSHIPVGFLDVGEFVETHRNTLDLKPVSKAILNAGSVGQPRDGNPDAAFAIIDIETQVYELHRCPYDWTRTQSKIQGCGLPEFLGERLSRGE